MSNCCECAQPIDEGARVIEMPCCALKYHSICGIQKLGNMLSHSHTVSCGCGNVLFQDSYYAASVESHIAATDTLIETVKAKDGVKAEMKAIRTKTTLLRKAYTEINRRIKNSKVEFDAAVAPHKLAIETLKQQHITPIKGSEEYKKFRGAKAGLQSLQSRFMKKHELAYRQFRRLMGYTFYNAWRYRTPQGLLRRAFRIRL